jgi:hypothetical protein
MSQLVGIFGPGVMSTDFATARMIRQVTGVGEPTGNPVDGGRRDGVTIEGSAEVVEGSAPGTVRASNEAIQARTTDWVTNDGKTISRDQAERSGLTQEDVNNMSLAEFREASVQFHDRSEDSTAPITPIPGDYIADAVDTRRPDIERHPGGGAVRGRIPGPGQSVEADFGPDRTQADALLGRESGSSLVGVADIAETGGVSRNLFAKSIPNIALPERHKGIIKAVGEAIASATPMPRIPGLPNHVPKEKRSEVSPAKVRTEEGAKKATENAHVPATNEQVQQAANQVIQAEQRGKQPTFVEVYNAVGLARLGIIDNTQLMNYARTGQLEGPAKAVFHNVGNGTIAVYDEAGGLQRVDNFGTGSKPQSQIEQFRIQSEFLEGNFTDEKGKVIPGLRQNSLNQIETAMDMLGIPQGTEARVDRSLLNSMQVGIQHVRNFSADPSQTIDLWPFSDPELQSNMAALGFVLDQKGYVGGDDVNKALFDYGIQLHGASKNQGATGEEFIGDVIAAESQIAVRMKDARTNPKSKYKGMSRAEIRDQLVNQMITGQ